MVKSKNIIAGLGVVAGLGMALLPLGAFATDGQIGGVTTDPTASRTVRGVVGDVISIELTNDNKEATLSDNSKISKVDLTPGKLNATLIHQVKVTTNARGGYDLKMAAKDGKTALRYITAYATGTTDIADGYSESIIIPTITAASGVALADKAASDTSDGAWGYRIADGAKTAATDFSGNFLGIPAEATRISGKSKTDVASETGLYNNTYSVNFGIVPSNNQLSGAYEATIVYSATTLAL